MTGEQIHELLNELDTNHNGQVEVEEYLQVRLKMCYKAHRMCFFLSTYYKFSISLLLVYQLEGTDLITVFDH